MNAASPHIVLTASSTLEHVSLVGAAVNGICRSIVSEGEAYQIGLCVVEACNNVIEHAYRYDETQTFSVTVTLTAEEISCSMRYGGYSFPEGINLPTQFNFDPNDIDNLPEGGMGLFIMGQLMDKIEITNENNINILTLTKFLHNNKTIVE